MSKYEKLWKYVKNNSNEIIKLSFDEVHSVLEFEIDHSFLNYKKN